MNLRYAHVVRKQNVYYQHYTQHFSRKPTNDPVIYTSLFSSIYLESTTFCQKFPKHCIIIIRLSLWIHGEMNLMTLSASSFCGAANVS